MQDHRLSGLAQQAAEITQARGVVQQVDGVAVGGEHAAFLQADALRPEQQLRGAGFEGARCFAGAAVEQTAQQGLHEQVDEQRRRIDDTAAE